MSPAGYSCTIHTALPSLQAMRRLIVLAILGGLTVAHAANGEGAYSPQACLSQAETRHAVSQKAVVAPAVAIRAAARAVGGRVLRASLCRLEDRLAYQITTLHRDGRISRVTVDGASGKVEAGR
jgi:uncharacterized membrane protein YkoI